MRGKLLEASKTLQEAAESLLEPSPRFNAAYGANARGQGEEGPTGEAAENDLLGGREE